MRAVLVTKMALVLGLECFLNAQCAHVDPCLPCMVHWALLDLLHTTPTPILDTMLTTAGDSH